MGVACFRRSYSKTQSSDGGGGGGGEGGGGRVKLYAGKKKRKTRGDWGEKFPPLFPPLLHLVFFSSSNFCPRPTILTHGTG